MAEEKVVIWLVQCLCPNRHCLNSSCYQEGRGDFDEVTKSSALIFLRRGGPYCLLCRSRTAFYEARQAKAANLAVLGGQMAAELQWQIPERERWLASGLPSEKWPPDLRWNFDHLLRDDGPVLTRPVERIL